MFGKGKAPEFFPYPSAPEPPADKTKDRKMRLYRILGGMAVANMVALVYVHQYATLARMSYDFKKNEVVFSGLVEENRDLNSEILKLKSPEKVVRTLSTKYGDLRMPGRVVVVKANASGARGFGAGIVPKEAKLSFLSFLGLSGQAEAKTGE